LPLHLTEYARDRARNADDPTVARFADLFHHRMLSLFYRAWAVAQPTVQADRPESDRFAAYVGSLFGIGAPSLRDRDAMPDLAKLHFAGRLACLTRHPEGLQAILETFFHIPVAVEEFVAHWMDLPENCRCRLGESPATATLGVAATIGARVWDGQHKFRIVLGPMAFSQFERMLPGGESLDRLTAVVRNYIGDELFWDVRLVLKKDEVPGTGLGAGSRLSRTAWLKSRPFARDADDLVVSCPQM
jgi:type VI secretion system protein ImpH